MVGSALLVIPLVFELIGHVHEQVFPFPSLLDNELALVMFEERNIFHIFFFTPSLVAIVLLFRHVGRLL